MTPEVFRQSNKVLQPPHGHDDVDPLHVYANNQFVLSCFRMTWRERLSALFFGRTWAWIITDAGTHPPIALQAKRTVFPKEK